MAEKGLSLEGAGFPKKPEPEKAKYEIVGDYLVEVVGGCTCGSGGLYPHEPYCGVEPIGAIESLLEAALGTSTLRERIKAALRLVQPDHLTPQGARILLAALDPDAATEPAPDLAVEPDAATPLDDEHTVENDAPFHVGLEEHERLILTNAYLGIKSDQLLVGDLFGAVEHILTTRVTPPEAGNPDA